MKKVSFEIEKIQQNNELFEFTIWAHGDIMSQYRFACKVYTTCEDAKNATKVALLASKNGMIYDHQILSEFVKTLKEFDVIDLKFQWTHPQYWKSQYNWKTQLKAIISTKLLSHLDNPWWNYPFVRANQFF
jgi:hypothetical protein